MCVKFGSVVGKRAGKKGMENGVEKYETKESGVINGGGESFSLLTPIIHSKSNRQFFRTEIIKDLDLVQGTL